MNSSKNTIFKLGKILAWIGLCLWIAPGSWAAPDVASPAAPSSTAVSAQTETLTFDQALALALQNNKTYRMQREREEAASARWWQALLMFGPTGTLQAGYVLENKAMTMSFDLGRGPQELAMATNYYSGQVSVSQPLFVGGKLFNAYRLAGLQYDSAKEATTLARGQLYQTVTQAFYGVMISERMLGAMETSLAQMNQHLGVVKARYREGSASNYDLLRSEVQVANMEPGVIKLRNTLILAKRNLAVVTGLDPAQERKIEGAMAIPEETWAPLESLQQQAQERRLELKNLERSRKMANIGHSLALWSNSPSVALTGSWTYYDTVDSIFPPQDEYLKHSWQVGIGVSWPFWDNFLAVPKTGEAAAKVREAELGQEALEEGIRMEVESAYLEFTTMQETLKAQKKNAELAEEGYRIAEKQYANGMMTNIDVMDAQLAFNQAQNNYLQTQYDGIVARVKLHRAIGNTF